LKEEAGIDVRFEFVIYHCGTRLFHCKFLVALLNREPCFGRIFRYLLPPAIGIFGRSFGRWR